MLEDGYALSVQGVLASIVFMMAGLLLIFRAYWDKTQDGNHVRQLVGFMTTAMITWIMLANFEPESSYGHNRDTIYFVVPCVVGLVFALFMYATLHVYIMLLGGLGALAFGLWILGWKSGLVIRSEWGRALFLSLLVLISMFYSVYHPSGPILGASLAGSYLVFMGLDIYFHTGFLYCLIGVLDSNIAHRREYSVTREVYILQCCLIIAVLLAYLLQTIAFCQNWIHSQHLCVMGGSLMRFPILPPLWPTQFRFWTKMEAPPLIPQSTVMVPPPVGPQPTVVVPA